MSYMDIALRVIQGIIRSQAARSVAKYAARQATAAVVKEVQRRTRNSRRSTMRMS